MPDYRLYWCPGTCARVPFVALEEIGEPFEVSVINRYGKPDSRYLALNPKGKVPALTVGDRTITENPAILTYLARQHPEAGLLPAGNDVDLEAMEMMSWFAAGVHRFITPHRFPQVFCDQPEAYESIRLIARGQLESAFTILDARLADREWLFGDWSIVDVYMLWLWFRATGSGMDGTAFPRCAEHTLRCEARPSVAKVLDREERVYLDLHEEGLIPEAIVDFRFQAGRSPAYAV
jgi:glutathione S-transferase